MRTTPHARAHHQRGAALVQSLVISALLTAGLITLVAFHARSSSHLNALRERTLERTTAEAAVEHAKAIVKNAILAGVPLESVAGLQVGGALNARGYELDLSLAPLGDVRATVGVGEGGDWAGARIDPVTGEVSRNLTSHASLDDLALQGEWRDAFVHGVGDHFVGVHRDGVFTRAPGAAMAIAVRFPDLNAAPSSVAARGSIGTSSFGRYEIGVMLDRAGGVWEWDLIDATPVAQRVARDDAGQQPMPTIVMLSAGDRFVVALDHTGSVWGWGSNASGAIVPSATHTSTPSLWPPESGRLPATTSDAGRSANVTRLAAGREHVLALDDRGRVWSWGSNSLGQLGRDCGLGSCAAGVLSLPSDAARITQIDAAGGTSLARDERGRVYVWGNGQQTPQLLSVVGEGAAEVQRVSAGASGSLAVARDGRILAFHGATAQPVHVHAETRQGVSTPLRRPDHIRAGNSTHTAIIGSLLFTWPAQSASVTSSPQRNPREAPVSAAQRLDGLTVTPGSRSLTLRWDAFDDELVRYRIETSLDTIDWQLEELSTVDTSYHLAGLTNGAGYYLRIRAYAGDDLRAEHVSGPHTPYGPPNHITSITTTPSDGSIDLSWSPPHNNGSPISHYLIEQRATGTPTWTTLPLTPFLPQARIAGLHNGTSYEFRIAAINAAGPSPYTTTTPTTPQGAPRPPTLEHATGHADHGLGAITLHWRAPSDGAPITGYRIETSDGNDVWINRGSAGSSERSHRIDGLALNQRYAVRVIALGQHGHSPPSNSISALTSDTPGAPTNLTISVESDHAIRLDWHPPRSTSNDLINSYTLERNASDGSIVTLASSGNALSLLDTGVAPGIAYQYRIAARTSAGAGAYSASVTGVTRVTPPDPPDSSSITRTHHGATTLALEWDPPSMSGGEPISEYTLRYRLAPSDSHSAGSWLEQRVSQARVMLAEGALLSDTEYEFQVAAHNSQYQGAFSASAHYRTARLASMPHAVSAGASGPLTITVSWSPPSVSGDGGIINYLVERQEGGGAWSDRALVPATAVSGDGFAFHDNDVLAGGAYRYRVSAIASAGAGDASPATDSVTALNRPHPPSDLHADTNPDGSVTLSWRDGATGGGTITGYSLQRSHDQLSWTTLSHASSAITHDPDGVTRRYTDLDTSDMLGQRFSYRVATRNELGTEHPSPHTPPTPLTTVITTPAAPTITNTSTHANTIRITWAAPNDGGSPITHYQLERRASDSEWTTTHPTIAPTTLILDDHDVTTGTTYSYRLSAHNHAGSSAPSHEASHTIITTLAPPAAPSAAASGHAQLQIDWLAPSDATGTISGYSVQRNHGCDLAAAWTTIAGSTTSTHWSDRNALLVGEAYCYRVATLNSAGQSGAWSDPSDAIVAPRAPDAPPAPNATVTPDHPGITLGWDLSSVSHSGHAATTHLTLQRSQQHPDGSWTPFATIHSAPESANAPVTWTDASQSVTQGGTLRYRLIVSNVAGDSEPGPPSPATSYTPPAQPPATPTITHATLTSSGGSSTLDIALEWSVSDELATSFLVTISAETDDGFLVLSTHTLDGAARSFTSTLAANALRANARARYSAAALGLHGQSEIASVLVERDAHD